MYINTFLTVFVSLCVYVIITLHILIFIIVKYFAHICDLLFIYCLFSFYIMIVYNNSICLQHRSDSRSVCD